MNKEILLNHKPCTIQVDIETFEPQKLWIKVSDAQQEHTYYTKRYAKINGKQTFFIRLPQSPKIADLVIYNDISKDLNLQDDTFKINNVQIVPLKKTPLKLSKQTISFIRFAQEFCEMAGVLEASNKGEVYISDNGKFRIDYFDEIRNELTGNVISTPARISQISGRIEVSKKAFINYSVPMRMAILLHEFSHFYINKNPHSEVQADLNGMKLYLAIGYPRIDAYNVFLNVFKGTENPESVTRFKKLDSFIKQNASKFN
jgi:hypothetical protein